MALLLVMGDIVSHAAYHTAWSKGDAPQSVGQVMPSKKELLFTITLAEGLHKLPQAPKPVLEDCGEDNFAAQERNRMKMRVFWSEAEGRKVVLREDALEKEAEILFRSQRLEKMPPEERGLSSSEYLTGEEIEALFKIKEQAGRLAGVYYI